MKKKNLFVIGITVTFILIGFTVFYLLQQRNNKTRVYSPVSDLNQNITPTPSFTLAAWTDVENGLSFGYPSTFTISKFDDKGSVAAFVLGSNETTDSITFKIQEPANAYTLKEWLPTFKEATMSSSVTGVVISGEKASQYEFTNPFKTVTAMFHTGVLYLFELKGNDPKNISAYSTLLSSFAFLPEENSKEEETSDSGGYEENVEYEGEEVVE